MLSTIQYVIVYFLMTGVFFGIDMIWLGLVAKNVYSQQIGHLMATKVQWPAAIIFYLLYIVGILYFAVLPGLEKGSLARAVINGAAFGFLAYATYDLTNLATLKGWPLKLTLIDLAWGTVITAVVAAAGWQIAQWIR